MRNLLKAYHLFRFAVSVHFDAKKSSQFVPIQSDVRNIKQILHPHFLAGRDRHYGYTGRYLFPLGHPKCDHILRRRPMEFAATKSID